MGRSELERALTSLDVWLIIFGIFVAIGVVGESVTGFLHWRRSSQLHALQTAENLSLQNDIAGLSAETETARASISEANVRAAEANKTADEERSARVKLEAQLLPRTLSEEQIELIRGLRADFSEINVAREVDIETHMFAQQIAMALMTAGIRVHQYRRAADVHTAGIQIYDPLWDASGPKSIGPLLDVFRKIDPQVMAIGGPIPPDIPAPNGPPIIIVGGRFALPSNFKVITDLARQLDAMTPSSNPPSTNGKRK